MIHVMNDCVCVWCLIMTIGPISLLIKKKRFIHLDEFPNLFGQTRANKTT